MSTINVLLSTFGGLHLPSSLCLPVPIDLSAKDLSRLVANLLPPSVTQNAWLSTWDGKRLPRDETQIAALLQAASQKETAPACFLPLRLNVALRGGKGGFGSQLRAAGGRMSSRKKKQNAELAIGSARNLDGRRLRTITEAKNLATYLATRPDMDRKEKEEKRKRWEAVVELAEQREADMRAGKTIDGRRKGLSSEWLEEKEEVGENIKNAVKLAMVANSNEQEKEDKNSRGDSTQDSADEDSDDEDAMELDQNEMNVLRVEAESGDADAIWVLQNKLKIPTEFIPKSKSTTTRFAGFDDDLSDSDIDAEPKASTK